MAGSAEAARQARSKVHLRVEQPPAGLWKNPSMASSRQWLTPLGLVMVALVVVGAGLGHTGFGSAGPGLLNACAAFVYAGTALVFLTRPGLPAPGYVALAVLMAAGVVGMRAADTSGDVTALFLLAALVPLRRPQPVLAVVALLGMLAFNVLQLGSGRTAITLILATDAGAAFFFLVGTLLRREKEQRERITGLLRQLEASRQAEQAAWVAAERARLARDLHDVLAHTLSGLALHLEGTRLLARGTNAGSRLSESIEQAHLLSRTGLEEARRAVQALRGHGLPGPELIEALLEQHRRTSTGKVSYRTEGRPVPLSPDASLALYRTAQEALSNIRKHAPGADVDVELCWRTGTVDLRLTDTGDPGKGKAVPGAPGFGLVGMAERAELAGGSLAAGTCGGGFQVRLALPLDGEGRRAPADRSGVAAGTPDRTP